MLVKRVVGAVLVSFLAIGLFSAPASAAVPVKAKCSTNAVDLKLLVEHDSIALGFAKLRQTAVNASSHSGATGKQEAAYKVQVAAYSLSVNRARKPSCVNYKPFCVHTSAWFNLQYDGIGIQYNKAFDEQDGVNSSTTATTLDKRWVAWHTDTWMNKWNNLVYAGNYCHKW